MKPAVCAPLMIACALAAPAFADDWPFNNAFNTRNAYVEAGYGAIDVIDSCCSATPGVGILRLGYNVTKNLAGELDGMATVRDSSLYFGRPISVKAGGIGLYLRAAAEPAPGLELFAKLGLVEASLTVGTLTGPFSTSGASASFGAGAQWMFAKAVYIQADYLSYYDKNGIQARGPSVSIGTQF